MTPQNDSETLAVGAAGRDPDVRLMLRVQEDDAEAFARLVERYQDRLIGVMVHLIGRRDEAEDLCQDVFLRVYRSRKSYRPQAKFSTWLFTIANNLAWNHLRSRGRNPSFSAGTGAGGGSTGIGFPGLDVVPGGEGTPSTQLRHGEMAEVVRAAVQELPAEQRMAVLLNKFEEMSYQEIAAVMQRSEAAIKSLLARARARLREVLDPYVTSGRRSRSPDRDADEAS